MGPKVASEAEAALLEQWGQGGAVQDLVGVGGTRVPERLMAVWLRLSNVFLAAEKLDLEGGFEDQGELPTQRREHNGEGILDRGTLCVKAQR